MDFEPLGVKFYYVYKALAHPENDGYVQPFTQAERLMHVKEARRTLGSRIPWICDGMDNALKHGLGDAPNSEFIIDRDGKVAVRRQWSNPNQLRRDLEELVAVVDPPTRISDLQMKTQPPPKVAPRGIVSRVDRPNGPIALRVEPDLATDGDKPPAPFYAKLRAEAESSLLREGQGKLYFGLHLDPLYHVHWNNLTKPIHVEFTASEDFISPTAWDGPKLNEPTDADPREFLADVRLDSDRTPLRVTVKYFACNDEQGFCAAVTQHYTIHWQGDRDAGWVQGRGNRRQQPPGNQAANGEMLEGTLVWFDSAKREISLTTADGTLRTLRVADQPNIQRNGRPRPLRDFEPGDQIRVRLQDGQATGIGLR